MTKGWFKLKGAEGERSLKEQMLGLDKALLEADGKTVMDLGYAEGLIALEFAKAGASHVWGVEYHPDFAQKANELLRLHAVSHDPLPVTFMQGDLHDYIAARERPKFDIVLALAILHKLLDPAAGLRYAAASCKSLLVIRLPHGSEGFIRGKHAPTMSVDVRSVLPKLGFDLEARREGPREEKVMYWRRREVADRI